MFESPGRHLNPGEVFGISALIPPFRYTTPTRVTRPSRVIKIDAVQLAEPAEV